MVKLLGAWGHRWSLSSLNKGDLDAGLLMWDMRRTVDPTVFPTRRIVVQFKYPDAPKGSRNWWLVSEQGEIELCLSDNGFDVDILIECSLKTMTAVWICQQSFSDAVKQGDIKAMGNSTLVNKLQDWLCASPLSKLGALGKSPEIIWG